MDDDHVKVMEKEGYVEAPDPEVFTSSHRKSSRLQSKKNLSSSSKYVFKSYHSNSKRMMKSSKASLCKGNYKIQGEKKHQFLHNGQFLANTISMKSSTIVPSFEYRVQAKDGIHLVVDLNTKRSDWIKSMEKTVCVCENHSELAFESFRKEVENHSASDASMNSYVNNKFSIKSVSREIRKTLPSVVEKEVITVSGSKLNQCWSKADPQSELALDSFENSEEVQLSDFSSPHKGSLCSTTGKMCSENLLISTNEVNQETDDNHRRSTVKIEEGINSTEGMEVSGLEENAAVISASDGGRKRKKHYYKSDQTHCQSHERILRSTQIFGGKIIEHNGVTVWRSSRLHSK